jgi:hypothetical protein
MASCRYRSRRGKSFRASVHGSQSWSKHENPFVAQPGGAPPTTFELASSGPHEVSFANPQHDFPKRIFYKRDRETLIARIDDGTDNGQAIEFRWHRCDAMTLR